MPADIEAIQADLRAAKLGGWLFCDFRGRDPIAKRILQLPAGMRTRRWFYFVPAKGRPKKLVHKIEAQSLAAVPGETLYYSAQKELHGNLKTMLRGANRVAMQYSPKNEIPYVATVDAGTIELVRSAGVKVVSSADLVQKYEAVWTPEQLASHRKAGAVVDRVIREAFAYAAGCVREKKPVTEYDLKLWILKEFEAAGVGERRTGCGGERERQRPSLWTDGGACGADSQRGFAVAGRLGENQGARQRILRRDLDGFSRRIGAGEVREGVRGSARRTR